MDCKRILLAKAVFLDIKRRIPVYVARSCGACSSPGGGFDVPGNLTGAVHSRLCRAGTLTQIYTLLFQVLRDTDHTFVTDNLKRFLLRLQLDFNERRDKVFREDYRRRLLENNDFLNAILSFSEELGGEVPLYVEATPFRPGLLNGGSARGETVTDVIEREDLDKHLLD